MKIGFYGINMGACANPEAMERVARTVEAAGFESVWTAEHVVLPDPQAPPSPAPPDTELLDPAAALCFVAGCTSSVRLGTGIIILPQRNPAVLAKELATVDVLSGGRLIFGLGAGYLEAEFRALGADFENRGAVTDEYIEAIRALWVQEQPSFAGEHVRFAGIQARPRPVQQPHPPIVVGGMSRAAHRRAARSAQGWYGFALDLAGTEQAIAGLREAADKVGRPAELGELEISVTPAGRVDADLLRRLQDLGVHRVIPLTGGRDADGAVRAAEAVAEALIRAR